MSERGSSSSISSVAKLDPGERRWVSKEELSEDGEEEEGRGNIGRDREEEDDDDEEEDPEERRLVRTGPLIDWFDVEALEVTGMDAKIEAEV